jgi:hypothetical protein
LSNLGLNLIDGIADFANTVRHRSQMFLITCDLGIGKYSVAPAMP